MNEENVESLETKLWTKNKLTQNNYTYFFPNPSWIWFKIQNISVLFLISSCLRKIELLGVKFAQGNKWAQKIKLKTLEVSSVHIV